jgi:hypothetical protein
MIKTAKDIIIKIYKEIPNYNINSKKSSKHRILKIYKD